MFHWITKIILSASIFLGITSPAISPTPIVDSRPTPTAIVSIQAMPKLTPKQIIKSQTPTPPITPTSVATPVPAPESTSMPTPTPTPIVYTETQTIARKFLSNPTLNNLKIFCEKAKSIDSSQTEEVLNEDKTAIRVVSIPLSETISSCVHLNNPNSDIVFIFPTSNSLLIDLCAEDTDTLRMSKIKWNNKMREDNQIYKLYGFNNNIPGFVAGGVDYELISGCSGEPIASLQLELYSKKVSMFINFNSSLVAPEDEISKLVK